MKKQLLVIAILVLISSITSCSSTKLPGNSVEAIVKSGDNYTYDLGRFGFEEGASIHQQAAHFEISEVKRNGASMVYSYKPAAGYAGKDRVVIKSYKGDIGNGTGGKESFTTIEMTVVP